MSARQSETGMVRATVAGLVAVLAMAGCASDDASPADTEVLGVVATDGGTPHVRSAAASEPMAATEREQRRLRVEDATVADQLHWGRAAEGGCAQILDPAVIERDDYVLSAGVRPFVEGDCPDWSASYDFTCVLVLQSAADHPTLMQGEATLVLVVDGEAVDSWSVDVDELAAPGQRIEIGATETVAVASDGLPDVRCDAMFTAA